MELSRLLLATGVLAAIIGLTLLLEAIYHVSPLSRPSDGEDGDVDDDIW